MSACQERGCQVSPPLSEHRSEQSEGQQRKEAVHARLEANREVYIRRARQALLFRLLEAGKATADDVAERLGTASEGINPRFLGTVPGLLARAQIIRRAGYVPSARPIRHASILTV